MSILFFLSGLAIGSFLNLCIDRLPKGESIIRLASRCDACQHRLKGRKDPIPFAPFLTIGLITTVVYGEEILGLYLGR